MLTVKLRRKILLSATAVSAWMAALSCFAEKELFFLLRPTASNFERDATDPVSNIARRQTACVAGTQNSLVAVASIVAIAAVLTANNVSQAQAAPSITYSGTVTPAPGLGETDWNWSDPSGAQLVVKDHGTLTISDGATAQGSSNVLILDGSIGVDGTGSSLTSKGTIVVGEYENASLIVSGGAHVNAAQGSSGILGVQIDSSQDAVAKVVVTGSGSLLTSDGGISVGGFGSGQLIIDGGGTVQTHSLEIDEGSVAISGAGSSLTSDTYMTMGDVARARLDISDGGSLNGSELDINPLQGTTSVINIGGGEGEAAQGGGSLNVDRIVFKPTTGQVGTDGILNFNTTDGTSLHADISGHGIIHQISGTTIFTGNNNAYTGSVSITGGVLQLGDGGTSGSFAVDISTGQDATHKGALAFDRSDNVTYSHSISGSGSLIQMGSGTTILNKSNSYSGGTTIQSGTLQLGNGGLSGSIIGDVVNNGTLAFDHSNNVEFWGAISGSGQVVQEGSRTLTFYGDNSFSGGLLVKKGSVKAGAAGHVFGTGILSLADGTSADFNGSDVTTGGLSGTGSLLLGSGTLTLQQSLASLFSGSIDGSGGLIKNGHGTQTLSGANSYSGLTLINEGTLRQGAADSFNATSAGFSVAQVGTLDLDGFSTSLAGLSNDGRVEFGGTGGAVLHIANDYSGTGGSFVLNTVLGDDNSKTDLLQIDGSSSGNARIYVQNQNGTGGLTTNGIKVVNIDGTSKAQFSLAGGYATKDGQQAIVAGAYAYTLEQGGEATPLDGDWYLISHMPDPDKPVQPTDPTCEQTNSCPPIPPAPPTPPAPPRPRYSAGAPVYEGYVQNMLALNKLPTLQQRVGNRYLAGADGKSGGDRNTLVDANGVWARVEGGHSRLEPSTSTARMKQDINTLRLQAGVDGQFYEGDEGRLIAGITGQYGHAKGDISSLYGDGAISTDAWSLGATATWYGNDGFYVDAQGQVTWFDSDLDSWTANQGLAHGRKATGYALSAETGKRMSIGGNWSLTPQAQLAWSSIDANAFSDVWNARVSVDDGESLLGRIGLAAEYATQWKDENDQMRNSNLYGIVNLYQAFLGGTSVNLSGVDFDTDNDRSWAGIGAGGSYSWADSKYAIYGEGSFNTALNHFADSYSLSANLGFKVRW